MAIPGVPQTFAVENASGMIEKLNWEIEGFAHEQDIQQKLWRGFNCAVTAWHITDWSWREMTMSGRLNPAHKKLKNYQDHVAEQCRALEICRCIANASKHSGVNKPNDKIEVVVSPNDEPGDDWLELQKSQHWELLICDNGKPIEATMVFYQAAKFWDDWLMREERALDPERFGEEA